VGVRVRRRGREVETFGRGQVNKRIRLCLTVEPTLEPTGIDAVARLGTRPNGAGKAEPIRDLLNDLLQSSRRDVDGLALRGVEGGKVECLAIYQRLQRRVPRFGSDLAHEIDRKPLEYRHPSVGRLPDAAMTRPEPNEHELRNRSRGELPAADKPAPPEGRGEREGARARDQRSIEVEERGPGHAGESTRGR